MKYANAIASKQNFANRHNPWIRPVFRSAVKYLNGLKRQRGVVGFRHLT